jgi:hypothetical protein
VTGCGELSFNGRAIRRFAGRVEVFECYIVVYDLFLRWGTFSSVVFPVHEDIQYFQWGGKASN